MIVETQTIGDKYRIRSDLLDYGIKWIKPRFLKQAAGFGTVIESTFRSWSEPPDPWEFDEMGELGKYFLWVFMTVLVIPKGPADEA